MKKIKSILSIVLCLLVVFLVTGCENKKAIGADDFKSIAEENNLTVSSILDQYKDEDKIASADFAVSEDDSWGFAFYVFDDVNGAVTMYNNNKAKFEENKEGIYSHSEVTLNNYATYSLTSNGEYMYLSRIDNTLVYARVSESYKDEVTEITQQLGY